MDFGLGYKNPPTMISSARFFAHPTIAGIHPEVLRRVLALCEASGGRVWIGEGARTRADQLREFLVRHELDPTGPILFEGRRWRLKPGMSPLAPPDDRSFHLPTIDGKAVAVDLVGDLVWANANCHRFGLRSFKDVGAPGKREPWHHQPSELPTARADYNANPAKYPLQSWGPPSLPPSHHTPIEEDEMLPIITNAEVFKDIGPEEWKWALMDDGQLRWLDPIEHEARGSKPGIPWLNDSLIRHGA